MLEKEEKERDQKQIENYIQYQLVKFFISKKKVACLSNKREKRKSSAKLIARREIIYRREIKKKTKLQRNNIYQRNKEIENKIIRKQYIYIEIERQKQNCTKQYILKKSKIEEL